MRSRVRARTHGSVGRRRLRPPLTRSLRHCGVQHPAQYGYRLLRPTNCVLRVTGKNDMNDSYKYDVALSFAGEDREYVEDVALQLKGYGVRVFYDKFEEDKLWGKNLYDYLSDVYTQKCQIYDHVYFEAL